MCCNTLVIMFVYNEVTKIGKGATMFKKYMIVVFILIATLTLSITSFAIDEDTTDEDYVHIISPVVGESGKTILNDSLFISIYVQAEDTLLLSMIKKEKPIFTFEEEKTEKAEFVDVRPLLTASAASTEEKVTLAEVTIVELSKEDIFSAYQIAEMDLEILTDELEMVTSDIVKISSLLDESLPLYNATYKLTVEETESLSYYEAVMLSYNEAVNEFIMWENRYNKLFETIVVDQEEMIVDPAFPYFEHTVANITPGNYELFITNIEGEIIKTFAFEIVTEDTIAESIKEDENIFGNIFDPDLFE